MSLFKNLLYKRIGLVLITICMSVFAVAVSLWWNAQLGRIINNIITKSFASAKEIRVAVITIISNMIMAYLYSLCSGWTCETLIHDLRMGYAEYFTTLSLYEIEDLNAGEQLSRLQNEISEISGFLRSNLFTFTDDVIKFVITFSWLLWLNPELALTDDGQRADCPYHIVYGLFQQGHWQDGSKKPAGQYENERFCGHIDHSISGYTSF